MKKSNLWIVLGIIVILAGVVLFMASKKGSVTIDEIVFESDERMAGMNLPREGNGLTKDYEQNGANQSALISINKELVAIAISGPDVLKVCIPEVMRGGSQSVFYAGYTGMCVVDANFISGTAHPLSQKMLNAIITHNQGVE